MYVSSIAFNITHTFLIPFMNFQCHQLLTSFDINQFTPILIEAFCFCMHFASVLLFKKKSPYILLVAFAINLKLLVILTSINSLTFSVIKPLLLIPYLPVRNSL